MALLENKSNEFLDRIGFNNEYHAWLPQTESTHGYDMPRVIDYTKKGGPGDTISIYTALNTLDSTLIQIAFGSCLVPTQFCLNTATQTLSFHSSVPLQAKGTDPRKVPVYLVLLRETKELDILDRWFVGYFSYLTQKTYPPADSSLYNPKTDSGPYSYSVSARPWMPESKPSLTPTLLPSPLDLTTEYSTQETQAQRENRERLERVVHCPRLDWQSDPLAMMHGWSEHEQKTGRRLVQFWKTQEGTSSVSVSCNVYRVKQPGEGVDFVLSCIHWDARGEPYLTSVDCLSLMEFLVGVIFTDEEKNRIRRNLQKFKPETVSKHSAWTQDYFKQIMSYTKPKPRNREKVIKVFRWVDLAPILQSILHRFTPSHSSVARIIQSS